MKKIKLELKNKDFKYLGIDYEYDTENSCSESGCDEERICRCGVILNAHIDRVDVCALANNIYDFYFDGSKSQARDSSINSVLYGTGKAIDVYCIDRVLRCNKVWEDNRWNIEVEGGYYGQEIGQVTLDSAFANTIQNDIEKVISLRTIKEKINFLLELEYGYILPELEGCDYELSTVSLSDIVFGSDGHYRKIQRECVDHYMGEGYSGIRGILKKDGADKYKIIDGYHRVYAAGLGKLKVSQKSGKKSVIEDLINTVQVILIK
jgi:hypothetical protein